MWPFNKIEGRPEEEIVEKSEQDEIFSSSPDNAHNSLSSPDDFRSWREGLDREALAKNQKETKWQDLIKSRQNSSENKSWEL